MLQSLFIQNLCAWENQTFTFNGEHAVLAGASKSGKTSVLQALDLFFNCDTIEAGLFRDPAKDVSIGIRYGGVTFKKTFSCKTLRVKSCNPAALWYRVQAVHYLYLPADRKTSIDVLTELAQAKAEVQMPSAVADGLAQVAQQAADEVLREVNVKESIRIAPKVLPARSIGFAAEIGGVPVNSTQLGFSKKLVHSMLAGSDHPNVVLGIDDVERVFAGMDFGRVITDIEDHVGQVLMTTGSAPVVQHRGVALTVPLGSRVGVGMAGILRGLAGARRMFLLVEGKYDLSWYRAAAELAGYGKRLDILPAGGTNIDELRREMASADLPCLAIVDGDTPPDERNGKYALERECVELYTPDELLESLFGVVPPKTGKREFFAGVQAARQASENGIKAAISERIADYLAPSSTFVDEVAHILDRSLKLVPAGYFASEAARILNHSSQ